MVDLEIRRLAASFALLEPRNVQDGVLGAESHRVMATDRVLKAVCKRAGRDPVTHRTLYRWMETPQSTPAYAVDAVCRLFDPPLTLEYMRGEGCSTADVLAVCSRVDAGRARSVLNREHASMLGAISGDRRTVDALALALLRLEAHEEPQALQSRLDAELRD